MTTKPEQGYKIYGGNLYSLDGSDMKRVVEILKFIHFDENVMKNKIQTNDYITKEELDVLFKNNTNNYLPKAGEECEVKLKKTFSGWVYCKVISISSEWAIVSFGSEGRESPVEISNNDFRPLIKGRQKLINKAWWDVEKNGGILLNKNIDCSSFGVAIIEDLIDAGWRPTK